MIYATFYANPNYDDDFAFNKEIVAETHAEAADQAGKHGVTGAKWLIIGPVEKEPEAVVALIFEMQEKVHVIKGLVEVKP